MNDRPLILITNDDGVEAKGIKELTECLRDLGDIVVFAPDGPRSGMASAIISLVPIKYTLVRKEKGLTVYSCTGTPVDCVKLAINEVLERKPDLLASGINHGGNHAICIQYSGTMGAAAEGCVFGIPSMGVSLLDHRADADFAESCRLGRMLARRIIKEGLPHGTYLNLNVPNVPNVKGMKVCRQADAVAPLQVKLKGCCRDPAKTPSVTMGTKMAANTNIDRTRCFSCFIRCSSFTSSEI